MLGVGVMKVKQILETYENAYWFYSVGYKAFVLLPLIYLYTNEKKGQEKAVIAVKVAENLVDVYIIKDRAFYYYNFRILD